MLVFWAPLTFPFSREWGTPIHSNSTGEVRPSCWMSTTARTSASKARIAAVNAPGIRGQGQQKFTQATWELIMLRVGSFAWRLPTFSELFDHLMSRSPKKPTAPPSTPNTWVQVLQFTAQNQQMRVAQPLVVHGPPPILSDGRRRITEMALAFLSGAFKMGSRIAPPHSVLTPTRLLQR